MMHEGTVPARAWLLTLLMVASTVAATASVPAQTTEPFEITDPAGDHQPAVFPVGPAPTPPTVATPVTDAADLTALRVVEETPTRLVLALVVNNLQGALHNQDAQWIYSYDVSFGIERSPVTYRISFSWLGAYNGAAGDELTRPQPASNICLQNPDDADNPFCHFQPISSHVDPENARFVLEIPKASLLGIHPAGDGAPAGTPNELPAGTDIIDWHAHAQMRSVPLSFAIVGFFVYLEDSMPDDGPSDQAYPVHHTAANARIAVRGPVHPDTGQAVDVAVAPGRATPVTLTVQNKVDAKRLVNLTADVADDSGSWSAEIAPSLEIPGRATRSVTLLVNGSTSLAHLDSTRIHVRAHALGHASEIGFASLRVVATVPPGPDTPTLHFHAADNESYNTICLGIPPGLCQAQDLWVNTLADDPRGTRDDAVTQGATFLSFTPTGESFVFGGLAPMDTPLTRPTFFEPDRPVDVTLSFQATVGFDARVVANLVLYRTEPCGFGGVCSNTETIGTGEATGSIGSDPSPFQTTFAIDPEFRRVDPDQGRLAVLFEVFTQDPRGTAPQTSELAFVPAESTATLPLMPNPEGERDGPTLIGLYPAGDEEEFVNPGKTRLFHALLVNEGVATDRLALEAETSRDGWSVDLRPGDKYELAAGASVNTTLMVTAPGDADEGETANVTLTAQSLNRTDDQRRLVFRAIATDGVQIDDQSDAYQADPEDERKVLADDTPESPGLPLLAVLAAVALAGAALRRSHRR